MSSSWPHLTGVGGMPFPGFAPTGRIVEARCMLGIPHVLMQLGYDVFAEFSGQAA